MLRHMPFIGNFPISQTFGENGNGAGGEAGPSIGHNGLDFATPIGTPVVAVQNGAVLAAGTDAAGYGEYVVLGHDWGQSLYAHLHEMHVVRGQQVQAGDQLGLSGNSGLSNGPHLHFGMRIHPFSVEDGWFGYSDPEPYLRRLTQSRGALIGPHIVGGVNIELLRRWQPRMVLVLDPNPDEMRRLREACPDTQIVGRVFATDQEIDHRIQQNPQAAAEWAHGKIMERMNPHVDYWQFANEVLQNAEGLPLLNQFELARMELAEQAGYRCAICAFSVGNPDLPEDNRMAHWSLVYPALERAERGGHVVAVHQYGMPNLWGPDNLADWLIFRLEHQILRRLPFKKLQFAVTEYGIDGLLRGRSPAGWQNFTSADDYVDQLLRNARYVERFSGRVLGYAVYTMGHNAPWGTYDIAGEVAEKLAQRSERGTWFDVTVNATGLTLSGDASGGGATVLPGSGGNAPRPDAPDEPEKPLEPDTPPPPEHPQEPPQPDKPAEPQKPDEDGGGIRLPAVERRISGWAAPLNLHTVAIADRPDGIGAGVKAGDTVYVIKDIFTTRNGSWEPSSEPNAVPQWARDSYLKPFGAPDWFDDGGADHHIFGAVLGLDGQLTRQQEIVFWSDGLNKLTDPNYGGYVRQQTKEGSGWTNVPLGPGSSYVPERGESGPWCWMPTGVAEVFCGGGLPARHHVSIFVVWQAVRVTAEMVTPQKPEEPATPQEPHQPEEPQAPAEDTPDGKPATPLIERRIGEWAQRLNVSVRTLHERPDALAVSENQQVVYLLKDIFTTRDGSWEASEKPGAAPEWARAYLRPVGAPDYFDDAGGDHHLFAAVLGLDGEFMRNQRIRFWSDGFDKLGDAAYEGYILRETKPGSGWINIPIGPGSSYVPERGESGPWCWAPEGAADVVCGGGLPAKQHVSIFAVWQAVRSADLHDAAADEPHALDKKIFLPFVTRDAAPAESRSLATRAAALPMGQAAIQPAAERADAPEMDAPSLLRLLRESAWHRVGIEYNQNSVLAEYARRQGLGMPVTQEFEVQGYRVQGYYGGIVFARSGQDESVRHMAW